MIKAIAFDYGGVIRIRDNDLIGVICDYLKISKEVWSNEYYKVNHLANVQNKAFDEIFTFVASKFNNSEETKRDILNILEEDRGKSHINNNLIEIIKNLKDKGYKIALLSNNSLILREKLKDDGIIDLFNSIIVSAEVGYQKPQPEIFEILFKKLELEPNEVIFVDDTSKSLEGADKIGYTPVLYKDNDSLKVELSNLLSATL